MMKIRRAYERGSADHGWLVSNHTFSFGSYYDPDHMGFRHLRVLNEDTVAPGMGFGTHPHKNMEILSYVRSGALEHRDSMGNGQVLKPGEFQIISAGAGISHSEFNPEAALPTHFYQIWIEPNQRDTRPSYSQRAFPDLIVTGLQLIAAPSPEADALPLKQDARVYRVRVAANEDLILPVSSIRFGFLHVVFGDIELNSEKLGINDAVAFSDIDKPRVRAAIDSECLLFDLS